jgi:Fur family ferric uptake transcriptional regulator
MQASRNWEEHATRNRRTLVVVSQDAATGRAATHSHDPTEDILDRLRRDGGRVTASRRAIIDAMVDSPSHHMTAADVVDSVRDGHPDFHESTVYRTLERLTELGVIDRIQIGAGPAVFHLSMAEHHHLVCDRCGAVEEAPPDLLEAVATRLRSEHGFALDARATPLHGLCVACRA